MQQGYDYSVCELQIDNSNLLFQFHIGCGFEQCINAVIKLGFIMFTHVSFNDSRVKLDTRKVLYIFVININILCFYF